MMICFLLSQLGLINVSQKLKKFIENKREISKVALFYKDGVFCYAPFLFSVIFLFFLSLSKEAYEM